MKRKGNKKMPIPRQEIIDNLHLFFQYNFLYTFANVPTCPKIATPVPITNRTAA